MALTSNDITITPATASAGLHDDTSVAGGSVIQLARLDSAPPAAGGGTELLEVLSTDPTDLTQTAKITARLASGGSTGGNYSLSAGVVVNGTTPVNIAADIGDPGVWELLRINVSPAATGSVNVRVRGAGPQRGTVSQNPVNGVVGRTDSYSMFWSASSRAAGITRYDKMFWRNWNPSGPAASPVFTLSTDTSARIRIGVHPSLDDSATIANRLTAPAGVVFVDDNIAQFGPTDIAPSSAQGVWVEFASIASETIAPIITSYQVQMSFQTL